MEHVKNVVVCRLSHLLMLLHCGVELLGQIVGYIRHPRLFLVGSADAALVFVGFLVVLLFGILAVSMCSLEIDEQECSEKQRLLTMQGKRLTGVDCGKKKVFFM